MSQKEKPHPWENRRKTNPHQTSPGNTPPRSATPPNATHDHSHHHGGGADKKRLTVALAITLTVMLAELAGAALTGSLTLLVDLGHMLTDCAGLTLAVTAAYLQHRPATDRRTWGWRRAEVISAALQSLLLILIGVYAAIEAIKRLVEPQRIGAEMLLAVGIIGLLGNLLSLTILLSAKKTTSTCESPSWRF